MTAGGHTFKGTETNSWRAQHGFVQTSVQPVSHDTVVTSNSSLYPGPEGAAAADLKGERCLTAYQYLTLCSSAADPLQVLANI